MKLRHGFSLVLCLGAVFSISAFAQEFHVKSDREHIVFARYTGFRQLDPSTVIRLIRENGENHSVVKCYTVSGKGGLAKPYEVTSAKISDAKGKFYPEEFQFSDMRSCLRFVHIAKQSSKSCPITLTLKRPDVLSGGSGKVVSVQFPCDVKENDL